MLTDIEIFVFSSSISFTSNKKFIHDFMLTTERKRPLTNPDKTSTLPYLEKQRFYHNLLHSVIFN